MRVIAPREGVRQLIADKMSIPIARLNLRYQQRIPFGTAHTIISLIMVKFGTELKQDRDLRIGALIKQFDESQKPPW